MRSVFIEIGIIAVNIIHNALSMFHRHLTGHSCLILIINGHLIALIGILLLSVLW